MRGTHAIGNNLEAKSLFLAEIPLTKNDPAADFGGQYFFPDLPQLTGVRIVGLEIIIGSVEIPLLQQPNRANLGQWSGFWITSYLTLFQYAPNNSNPEELIRNAPLALFRLNGASRLTKRITALDSMINWRASYITVVGFSPAPIPPTTIYMNFTVYYL